MHSHWRRFMPKKRHIVTTPDGGRLSTIRSVEDAGVFIDQVKATDEPRDKEAKTAYWKSLVLAQTPRAAAAQVEMDAHKHGYHNREKRLYELIDFNDAFVSLILSLPHDQLPGYAEQLKSEMTQFCRRLNVPMFSDAQYTAITKGLSREIAVYRGAIHEGYDVRMTSRVEDAFGIDMIITNRDNGRVLNIDCKTPSSFRHRLEELVKEGRLAEQDLITADERGFVTTDHRRNDTHVPVTLFCILPDRLDEITDFTFEDTSRLGEEIERMFKAT